MTLDNIMEFDGGYKAVIAFDPEIEMFRGDFVGLNGDADFYASDMEGLRREGTESLRIFLEECKRHDVSPNKLQEENSPSQFVAQHRIIPSGHLRILKRITCAK